MFQVLKLSELALAVVLVLEALSDQTSLYRCYPRPSTADSSPNLPVWGFSIGPENLLVGYWARFSRNLSLSVSQDTSYRGWRSSKIYLNLSVWSLSSFTFDVVVVLRIDICGHLWSLLFVSVDVNVFQRWGLLSLTFATIDVCHFCHWQLAP